MGMEERNKIPGSLFPDVHGMHRSQAEPHIDKG